MDDAKGETRRLWSIRRAVSQILADRGYEMLEEERNQTLHHFTQMFGSKFSRSSLDILAAHTNDDDDLVYVCFSDKPKVGVSDIKSLYECLYAANIKRSILMVQHDITPEAIEAIQVLQPSVLMEHILEPDILVSNTLWMIRAAVVRLLTDRGYQLQEEDNLTLDKIIRMVRSKFSRSSLDILAAHTNDGDDLVYVCFSDKSEVGVSDIKSLYECLYAANIKRSILMIQRDITPEAKEAIQVLQPSVLMEHILEPDILVSNSLWMIRTAVVRLLTDRGYQLQEEDNLTLDNIITMVRSKCRRSDLNILTTHTNDPDDSVYVAFHDNPKPGLQDIKTFLECMRYFKISRAIIVVQEEMTPNAKLALEKATSTVLIDHFTDDEMLIVIANTSVSEHIVLTSNETVELLHKYQIEKSQLKRLKRDDLAARYYGLKRGDVVRIIVLHTDAGKSYVTYRLVQ